MGHIGWTKFHKTGVLKETTPYIWRAECARPLADTANALGSYARTVRVARTIAALDAADVVRLEHVEEGVEPDARAAGAHRAAA